VGAPIPSPPCTQSSYRCCHGFAVRAGGYALRNTVMRKNGPNRASYLHPHIANPVPKIVPVHISATGPFPILGERFRAPRRSAEDRCGPPISLCRYGTDSHIRNDRHGSVPFRAAVRTRTADEVVGRPGTRQEHLRGSLLLELPERFPKALHVLAPDEEEERKDPP